VTTYTGTDALTITVSGTPAATESCSGSQEFLFTGGAQSFVVPAGATSLSIDARGASGGAAHSEAVFGLGGRTQATVTTTPGETLHIYVGGAGVTGVSATIQSGGFNGGGSSGRGGGSGGGASDVRQGGTALANRVVVAGGGGGTGGDPASGSGGGRGGDGGGLIADAGADGATSGGPGGEAGEQVSVVYAGNGTGGTLGVGGNGGLGGTNPNLRGGGGGGGGYYGGGGGSTEIGDPAGGGGGGSSYTDPGASAVTHTQAYQTGDGTVILSWTNVASPSSSFVALTPTVGEAPLTVSFDASGTTGEDVTYAWDFGDGGTSTSVTPSHTFSAAGTYTVSLTASNYLDCETTVTGTVTALVATDPCTGLDQVPAALADSTTFTVGAETVVISNLTGPGGVYSPPGSGLIADGTDHPDPNINVAASYGALAAGTPVHFSVTASMVTPGCVLADDPTVILVGVVDGVGTALATGTSTDMGGGVWHLSLEHTLAAAWPDVYVVAAVPTGCV
jgi:PKD repeat protein